MNLKEMFASILQLVRMQMEFDPFATFEIIEKEVEKVAEKGSARLLFFTHLTDWSF